MSGLPGGGYYTREVEDEKGISNNDSFALCATNPMQFFWVIQVCAQEIKRFTAMRGTFVVGIKLIQSR